MFGLKTAFVLITSIIISPLNGCQVSPLLNKPNLNNVKTGTLNEGPNSTGALKEGPNSTGALKEKILFLTQKINGVENPLSPENISSIEIVSKDTNTLIKTVDIKQNNQLFSIKSESIEVTILFEGSGNFVVKFNKEIRDLVLKFKLKDFDTPVMIPLFTGLTENKLRAVIESGADGQLTLTGGIINLAGEIDTTKVMFVVNKDEKGNINITLIKPDGSKETYFLNKIEESIKNGDTIKPDKIETVIDLTSEKKQIEEKVQKLSTIAGYVGSWIYQGLGKELIVNIIDLGDSKFSGKIIINGKNYGGAGTYQPNSKNEFLFIDSSQNDSKISVKVELLGPNTLGFTLIEVTNPELLIYRDINLELKRKLN